MLLLPTVDGVQAMLDVCRQFAKEKCSFSMISQKLITADPHLQLCDINIPVTRQFIHLGCLFN